MWQLDQIIGNEYIFTFVVAILTATIKSFVLRSTRDLANRGSFDMGIELVFVALSFAASQLGGALNEYEAALKSVNLPINTDKLPISLDTATVAHLQQSFQLKSQAMITQVESQIYNLHIMIVCLVGCLVLMSLSHRFFAYDESNQPHLWEGILVPNAIGVFAIAVVMYLENA